MWCQSTPFHAKLEERCGATPLTSNVMPTTGEDFKSIQMLMFMRMENDSQKSSEFGYSLHVCVSWNLLLHLIKEAAFSL